MKDASQFSINRWNRILGTEKRFKKRRASARDEVSDDERGGGFFVPSPTKATLKAEST